MEIERVIQFISNHWILSTGFFIVNLLLIQDIFEALTRKYKVASPAVAVALLNEEDSIVIDVRDLDKYVQGHIEGAEHVAYSRLKDKIYEFEDRKNSPVLVYCQQGTVSKEACKQLIAAGFTRVYSLEGGIITWQDQKLPLVKRNKKQS